MNYYYMNWTHTTIQHGPRKAMGLSSDEYVLLDCVWHTQTSEVYGKNGWCEHSYAVLADMMGLRKAGVFAMVDRLVKEGLMEVDPANPARKRTAVRFHLMAHLSAELDDDGVLVVRKVNDSKTAVQKSNAIVRKVNDERSKIERNRSKSERHITEEIEENISINLKKENAPEKIPPPVVENPNALQWGDGTETRLEKANALVRGYILANPERLQDMCRQARNRCNETGFWDELGEYLRHHADNYQIMQNPVKALTSGPSNFVSWLSKPWCRDKYLAAQPDPPKRRQTPAPQPERERMTPEQALALREKYAVK